MNNRKKRTQPINRSVSSIRRSEPLPLRTYRLKPWAAGMMLTCVLLLGGCIRFGPQADEMEQTANQQSEQGNASDSSVDSEIENGEAAGSKSEDGSESAAGEDGSTAKEDEDEDEAAGSAEESEPVTSSQNDTEQDAKNQANQIEVSVTRTDSERTVRFDLQRLPSGYSLSGMTWEADLLVEDPVPGGLDLQGESSDANAAADEGSTAQGGAASAGLNQTERFVSTYQDAVAAGEAGTEGFFVDMDGQRIGYRYREDQVGRSGKVRLDFRDSEGSGAAWEARITLGIADTEVQEVQEIEEESQ